MSQVSSSYSIKGKLINNRIVFAPTRTFTYVTEEGTINQQHIDHYSQIAEGKPGLLILEASAVAKPTRPNSRVTGIWSDDFIPGLSEIAKLCHSNEVVAIAQIGHNGFKEDDVTTYPGEYSTEEVDEILENFTDAAIRAQKAGFDGVEIHAVHGFFISSLLSDKTNQRTDKYGGSPKNRAFFAVSLIERIREKLGDEFIIVIRMAYNETDSLQYAKMFEQAGADILHVSFGVFPPEDINKREAYREGLSPVVYGAYEIKKAVSIPVISVYGTSTREQVDLILDNGYSDFVAASRAILADPQWPSKIINGEDVDSCLHCRSCSWFSDCHKCPARKK